MKIAVYAISKNEEQFVKRFCESAKDADLVLIADTGSTDNTVAEAKKYGAITHNIVVNPWRFDIARDVALCLLPADIDVCISLDLDEELQEGWREEIERVWQKDTTRLRYKFDWGQGIAFFYEKIHHRKGYHWHHPCHEYPVPDIRTNEVWGHTDKLLVVHKPDPTKSRGQYLDLLEVSIKEDPRCPRNAFYYARELTFYNKHLDAIVALNKYLEMPEATWQNERCYAMRLLGKTYDALGQDEITRQTQYRELFIGQIDEISLSQMREATNKAWVLGSEHFKQKIASQLNRRSDKAAKGGDRKSDEYKKQKINRD
jgi:glycosyltransferase involved in cell wall biosynthesis